MSPSPATRSAVSTASAGTGLADELKVVLPQLQQRRNRLDFKKTPDIFIDQVRVAGA